MPGLLVSLLLLLLPLLLLLLLLLPSLLIAAAHAGAIRTCSLSKPCPGDHAKPSTYPCVLYCSGSPGRSSFPLCQAQKRQEA